ncbi:capsid protein [Capybara virus 1_cap1_34]|nr:capsid protein [Capybara virus 1_cap1_34]
MRRNLTGRKTRRSRRSVRRRTTRRKITAKSVRLISRSQTLRLVETKRFVILNESFSPTPTTNVRYQWYWRNIFANVAQGAASFNIVGSEIVNPMLVVKLRATVDWYRTQLLNSAGNGMMPVTLTMFIVAANEQFAFTTPRYYDNSTTFGWIYQPDMLAARLNGNNCKVLKKWSITINPPSLGQGTYVGVTQRKGKMSYRWKRKLTYEDAVVGPNPGANPVSSYLLRGWNYYLLGGYSVPYALTGSPLLPPVDYLVDTYLYYKDP